MSESHALTKKGFFKILAKRLEDPDMCSKDFILLARLYADCNRWRRVDDTPKNISVSADSDKKQYPSSSREVVAQILELEKQALQKRKPPHVREPNPEREGVTPQEDQVDKDEPSDGD